MNAIARIAPPELDLADLRSTITEIEQNTLGAALTSQPMFSAIFNRIGEGRFYDPFHRSVWAAMCECSKLSLPVSPHMLAHRLPPTKIGDMTVPQYLARLYAETSLIPQAVDATMTWLMELWSNHALVEKMDEVRARALAPDARTRDITTTLLEEVDLIRAALDRGGRKDRAMLSTFAGEFLEHLQDRLAGRGASMALECGLAALDRKLGGFQRGGVTVIAGRPGMGKTALAADLAYRLAERDYAGGFFSIEMGADQVMPRFFSAILTRTGPRVEYSSIIRAEVSDDVLTRMSEAERAMERLPLFIDTVSAPTVSEIQSRCRSATAQLGRPLDFIVVDYLGLVSASTRYQGQRAQEVGEVSRAMKALAKSMGCALILLAQLNRKNEDRGDKRPELSDLRDSGEIEQDAEAVIFPFREAYYLQNKTAADDLMRFRQVERQIELIIAKNRHGSTGMARLYCDIGANLIDNLDER